MSENKKGQLINFAEVRAAKELEKARAGMPHVDRAELIERLNKMGLVSIEMPVLRTKDMPIEQLRNALLLETNLGHIALFAEDCGILTFSHFDENGNAVWENSRSTEFWPIEITTDYKGNFIRSQPGSWMD